MPTRDEMNALGREIVGAYEARTAGISSLRQDVAGQRRATQTQLHDIGATHQAMARQQRADLGKGRADLARNTANQLHDVGAARRTMARQQRADLDKGRADLARNTASRLHDVGAARQAMARQQRAELGKGRADLTRNTASRLHDAGAARRTMARQQRADLGKGRADLARTDGRRRAETNAWMQGVAATHAGATDEWRRLAATMEAKRSGVVPVMEAPRPIAVTPVVETPRLVVVPPPPALAEEEAVAMAEVGEVTPELASLSERVFEYLANHPDGTRLIELEREFGMSRLQMARVVRNLMDEGKAEKRDLFYFAT